jgi:uncharacterized membrane protein YkvA (DUF1232 family)
MPIRSIVIPFLKLVWRLLLDKRVPAFTKIIPLLAVAYLISPYDFIADRIPILGQFDDLIVISILLLLFVAASPGAVVADQTIGRKLRDLQKQAGQDPNDPQRAKSQDDGKTVDAEFRHIEDDPESESDDDSPPENRER